MATNIIINPEINWTKYGKNGHNGKGRSKTFSGLASAMAQQWTDYLTSKYERIEDAS